MWSATLIFSTAPLRSLERALEPAAAAYLTDGQIDELRTARDELMGL